MCRCGCVSVWVCGCACVLHTCSDCIYGCSWESDARGRVAALQTQLRAVGASLRSFIALRKSKSKSAFRDRQDASLATHNGQPEPGATDLGVCSVSLSGGTDRILVHIVWTDASRAHRSVVLTLCCVPPPRAREPTEGCVSWRHDLAGPLLLMCLLWHDQATAVSAPKPASATVFTATSRAVAPRRMRRRLSACVWHYLPMLCFLALRRASACTCCHA